MGPRVKARFARWPDGITRRGGRWQAKIKPWNSLESRLKSVYQVLTLYRWRGLHDLALLSGVNGKPHPGAFARVPAGGEQHDRKVTHVRYFPVGLQTRPGPSAICTQD